MASLPPVPVRKFGSQGAVSAAQGFGCMGLTAFYTSNAVPEKEAIEVIHRALDLGVTHLDTSNVYGPETNEKLIGKALKGRKREDFFLATKFGCEIDQHGFHIRGTAKHVRHCINASLERLQTHYVDLYYQHRVDRSVPIEETWSELKKLVEEGKVRYLGISEASPEEIRRAHAVHPISAVQLEWSLWSRSAEADVIPLCRELGIAIVAYSPLGRGFLTGAISDPKQLHETDYRSKNPRFHDANFYKNLELMEKLRKVAARVGVLPGQLSLAWVHAQGDDVFPIPGTKRIKYLEENVAALGIQISPQVKAELEDIFHPDNVAGLRYDEASLSMGYEAPRVKA